MLNHLEIEPVEGQPWVRYDVVTGHGSHLSIYYKHDKNLISPETGEVALRGGDMHVSGYSESTGSDVEFWGLGFEPEVHGHVAVGIIGRRADGSHQLAEEMITSIQCIQEVGHPPQST